MSHKATTWAFKIRGLSSDQRVILLFLADCHCPSRGCFASPANIAEWSEMDKQRVLAVLQELEAQGHIRVAESGAARAYLGFEFGSGGGTLI